MTEQELTQLLHPVGLCVICRTGGVNFYDWCGQVVLSGYRDVKELDECNMVLLTKWYKKRRRNNGKQ